MFAADARKHTPGKNAEKENFSMRILVCDDDAAFAGQLAEKIEAIVKPQMQRCCVLCRWQNTIWLFWILIWAR